MNRRSFIQNSAIATGALASAPYILNAKKDNSNQTMSELEFLANDNIMIILDLFGGNDGLNTVIPAYDDTYYQMRPNIGISTNDAIRWGSSDVYFHPALVTDVLNDGFLGLMDTGRLAIIQNVGYDKPTLSHFRSSDIWSSGINNKDPQFKLLEGWLGKYFASKLESYPEKLPVHPLTITIGGQVPLVFKSQKGHLGIAMNDPNQFVSLGAGLTPDLPILNTNDNYSNEYNFIHSIATQSNIYSKSVEEAMQKGKTTVNYTGNLAQKFKTIAHLISGGLKTKVYFIRMGSFDSHAQQMDNPFAGQHPQLLKQIAEAISQFYEDATNQGFAERVAGMTTSEFGRRVYDNGSRGTDHGAASVQFVFGHYEYVEGGVYGDKPKLNDLDNGNLRHDFDFRRIYTAFLESWFGATQDDVESVFNDKFLPLPVLKPRTTSVFEPLETKFGSPIKISPNPSFSNTTVTFELKFAAYTEVSVYTLEGFKILDIINGNIEAGIYNFDININKTGNYFVSVLSKGKRYTEKFMIIR